MEDPERQDETAALTLAREVKAHKDFPFTPEGNPRRYATRQVRPIFVDEPDEIVVLTVYVYYF